MRSVVGGVAPRRYFDHERFSGTQDSNLIGAYFGGVGLSMGATRLAIRRSRGRGMLTVSWRCWG